MGLPVTITDYGISLTQAGKPQVTVKFTSHDGKEFTWWGSLNEGMAREITLKNLFTMGFNADTLDPLAQGLAGGALNHVQEYEIVTEEQMNPKTQKMQTRVKFINLPGQSTTGKLKTEDALKALSSINAKGDILAAKKQITPAQALPKTGTEDEIPF